MEAMMTTTRQRMCSHGRPRLQATWAGLAVTLVAALLLVGLSATVSAARPREIDFDVLEKAWEVGDASSELRSDADEQHKRLSDASEHDAKALGPQMVFVTLKDANDDLAALAEAWKEMLWNGGVEASLYEIEPGKVLVGVQKGMFITELRTFLHEQPQVKEYEWNSRTYSATGKLMVEGDMHAVPMKTAKIRKNKAKLKSKSSSSAPRGNAPQAKVDL